MPVDIYIFFIDKTFGFLLNGLLGKTAELAAIATFPLSEMNKNARSKMILKNKSSFYSFITHIWILGKRNYFSSISN